MDYHAKRAPSGTDSCTGELIGQVLQDLTPRFAGLTAQMPLVLSAATGTRLPSTDFMDLIDRSRSSIDAWSGGTRLSYIPMQVANFLFENYLRGVVTQYPIFYVPDVVMFFRSVFHNATPGLGPGELASPYEIFIVSLIMAISLTTSARAQQLRANSIATGLFKTAMKHIQSVCTNDLRGLQALLLLCQYVFLNPSVANVWFISGFTTHLSLDMGLHCETPESLQCDPLTVDIRRRVFWCAFEMEIATSGALLQATQFQMDLINVPFPSEVVDSAISREGIDLKAQLTKFPSRRIWIFRQIEAEVVSVLFHRGPLSPQDHGSLDAWMERMEKAIKVWREETHWYSSLNQSHPASQELCLYADIACDYVIITLYRPSHRVRDPVPENLMKAFQASVGVPRGYSKQLNLGFGNSKYVFHPCHHSFSAAVVFLQALERCKEWIYVQYTLDDIESFISVFSSFFSTIAERWPASLRCLQEFERLMVPVRQKYIDFTQNRARTNSLSSGPLTVGRNDDGTAGDEWIYTSTLFPQGAFNMDELSELAFTIPSDWGMEFDLGII